MNRAAKNKKQKKTHLPVVCVLEGEAYNKKKKVCNTLDKSYIKIQKLGLLVQA